LTRLIQNLVGRQFGRLSVKSLSPRRGNQGQLRWKCSCECGKQKTVEGNNLKRGVTQSCGCLRHAVRPRVQPTVKLINRRVVRPIVATISDERCVLAAFKAAGDRGTLECYLAAVAAWQGRHPDHSREYAGRHALEIILHNRYPGCCRG
jgi:hypothetical protein